MSSLTPTRGRGRWFAWAAAALLLAVLLALATIGFASAQPGGKAAPKGDTPQPVKTAKIAAEAPVAIVGALKADVTDMKAVQGAAHVPGEIAGPAVRFTVRITNGTADAVDLSKTVVTAYYGADKTPANELTGSGAHTFPATLKPGHTATGAFVFTIPTAERGTVQVSVDTSVANPVVAFSGSAPK